MERARCFIHWCTDSLHHTVVKFIDASHQNCCLIHQISTGDPPVQTRCTNDFVAKYYGIDWVLQKLLNATNSIAHTWNGVHRGGMILARWPISFLPAFLIASFQPDWNWARSLNQQAIVLTRSECTTQSDCCIGELGP